MPKYKFVNCQHKDFNKIQYGYVLEISNVMDFFNYLMIKFYPDMTNSISSLIKALENNHHASDPIGNTILILSKTSDKSPIDIAADLTDSMIKTQLQILDKGPLYIHKNGSYMNGGAVKIHNVIELDSFVWPSDKFYTENDININKYFGGNHYYVKVDEINLGKTNTPEEATLEL